MEFGTLELEKRNAKMIVLPIRLTQQQYEKCAQVGRMLGVDRTKAIRAMIDAVTVDATEPADYTPTVQDVLAEENWIS